MSTRCITMYLFRYKLSFLCQYMRFRTRDPQRGDLGDANIYYSSYRFSWIYPERPIWKQVAATDYSFSYPKFLLFYSDALLLKFLPVYSRNLHP